MIRRALLLAWATSLAPIGCGGNSEAESATVLPSEACFPGVWQIGIVAPCWCNFVCETTECGPSDCEFRQVIVLRDDGVADRHDIQMSLTGGSFSSCRGYSTTDRWELRGDELVLDVVPGPEVGEDTYAILACTETEVTVDSPSVTNVTRHWTRPDDVLIESLLAASTSATWTEAPIPP